MITIRPETPADQDGVRQVHELAFGRSAEANLVDTLRTAAAPQISLVAVDEGVVVGHVFFSPMTLEPDVEGFSALGLAPLAVLPQRQGKGVGSALARRGLEECRALGTPLVFVLGSPDYYPRFGFGPTVGTGLACEFNVPAEVFMVAELTPGSLSPLSGIARYMPQFNDV